jgi:4-hydroxy 2-oxovalerate aldolase
MSTSICFLDCTFRDGGYYNNWDFPASVYDDYLEAMAAAGVDCVELGFRSFERKGGFKGACAYTTDAFIRDLPVPAGLKVGVMVNASEIVGHPDGAVAAVAKLFVQKADSPVDLVRIACHMHEFEKALPACKWLQEAGYSVGINLMQIADRTDEEVEQVAALAAASQPDVLYFADSLGSMEPDDCVRIVLTLRRKWAGPLGIHTHDNMGRAVVNTLRAIDAGVTWVDSTVTGMGRGPGNAQTEYLAIELKSRREGDVSIIPLLKLVREHFQPMKDRYGWGMNPYYYMAGKSGIHPLFVQEMMADSRYDDADILAAMDHLDREGGKKYSVAALEDARRFYRGEPRGTWKAAELLEGRDVLILGAGPGVLAHRKAIEAMIERCRPIVLALNTTTAIDSQLIDLRAACHPVRLLADGAAHTRQPQPLATPASMLPAEVTSTLQGKQLLDFGISVQRDTFEFHPCHAIIPSSLVVAYALAIAASGRASRVLLAGFDGYGADDPRTTEMQRLLDAYLAHPQSIGVVSLTPTRYSIPVESVYAY